ncbi:hypothetical protein IBG34_23175 (plasmid) [Aeromonas media]|uniref:Uncharacterized protein n=1 Tax=Aeromonas caviae TaxID=648 RepID=A0A7D5YUV6_AERCA|nr:hypothetical protein [Aeromonas caviae]QLI60458.1 hypothetical protein C1C91_23550 [Aeromonas caviae]QYK83479.1 hypothetical protein IBG34_23740 [Aeromonas media]QYK83499.1 hypothetical protein IBG34_23175 [Aeromonas media]
MSHQYQSTADLQALAPALLGAIIERCDSMNDLTLCMWLREAPIVGQLRTLRAHDIAFVREGVRQLVANQIHQSGQPGQPDTSA